MKFKRILECNKYYHERLDVERVRRRLPARVRMEAGIYTSGYEALEGILKEARPEV